MKANTIVLTVTVLLSLNARVYSQGLASTNNDSNLKVVLLGTAGGPTFNAQRSGISTLVLAGSEKLLFDCGRAMTTGMAALNINPTEVTKVFLTHLHSDHIISLPELYLFAWAQGRDTALQLWGPEGTRSMMKHLGDAFAFDIHLRRDVDEKLSAEGVKVITTDIHEGVVHEANGVKVTAFIVDHAPVKPAFGYRVDYHGHSAVVSGDTKPSDNLVKFSQGVDLLIHECGLSKEDPSLVGQRRIIADHHTDGTEAGRVFQRVKPKLAVISHYNVAREPTLALIRRNYAGPVEFGEDLTTIEIGDIVTVHRFARANR